MAKEATLKQLHEVKKRLENLDTSKLLRPNIGEESLQGHVEDELLKAKQKLERIVGQATYIHDDIIRSYTSLFSDLVVTCEQQAKRNNLDYIQSRREVITTIQNKVLDIDKFWPSVVAAEIDNSGLLKNEGIKKQYDETVENLKSQTTATLEKIKSEAEKTINEAKKLADEIEARARKTATKISVAEAQTQFRAAQRDYNVQVAIWSIISVILILSSGSLIFYFLTIEPPKYLGWHLVYFGSFRLATLAAAVAVTAFSLRILRAHLHMRQLNLHRQRVANSIEAFVQSAMTEEQRDLILGKLVDSICSFGESGLIQKNSDDSSASKLVVDSVSRTIGASYVKS